MTRPAPRPGILEISPYVGGESGVPGIAEPIVLSSNESALGPSPKVVAALQAHASLVHRYPDGGSVALRDAIGAANNLDPARIVCGNGSDELLSLLAQIFSGQGDEVLYSEYGFLMYKISALAVGATPLSAPETNFRSDIDSLLGKVTEKTKILFLANPNNPTGTYLTADELERLRDGLRDDILLVIDAAYAEFMSERDFDAGAALVDKYENVVMTRTFSKLYALAGLRLGWAYAPAWIVDLLNRVRGPFNVTAAAQVAGVAALSDPKFYEAARVHNDTWRPWLSAELEALGLKVVPGFANFVLVRFETAGVAEGALNALKLGGILVRAMAGYGLPDALRITVGRAEDNQLLVASLRAFLDGVTNKKAAPNKVGHKIVGPAS